MQYVVEEADNLRLNWVQVRCWCQLPGWDLVPAYLDGLYSHNGSVKPLDHKT